MDESHRSPASEPPGPLRLDRGAKVLVWILLIYWGLFALLTPVTVTDAQVYNLARLPLAERFGLFGHNYWFSEREIFFPWSFDALHLIFLKLGFGYALPSYLCLVGTLLVVFRLGQAWAGTAAGWWTLLFVLSMSTIVFQSTSTKNDLGVVFAAAAGYYAWWRFRQSNETLWLLVLAIAIGFLPGIKDSGFLPAAGLTGLGIWQLRRNPRWLLVFAGEVALMSVLLGSAEIYYDNWLRYRDALGPPDLVAMHSNRDGLRGAAASLIRYFFGVINLGWTPPYGSPPYVPALERMCRAVLRATGLVNVGYWTLDNDASLKILRLGGESSSDYALSGTCLALLAVWQLLRRSWRDPAWRLAALGMIYAAGLALTVAWMPFNNRFLMPSFVLFALAVAVGEQGALRHSRVFRGTMFAVAAYSAIIPTYYSFNKQPRDLLGGVTMRQWEFFLERRNLQPIAQDAQHWLQAHPTGHLMLLAGGDSSTLVFFIHPFQRVDPLITTHPQASDLPPGHGPLALLTLDRTDFNPAASGLKLHQLQTYPDPGSVLYEIEP